MVKRILFTALMVFCGTPAFSGETLKPTCDGTPRYGEAVMQSHRKLQLKTSIYDTVPAPGTGIRLGIYQAQAACGKGATLKNMARLEMAVAQAKQFQAQLLSFPELYVPGYTLSPEMAKEVAEPQNGPSITKGCAIAKKNHMALLLPYAEKVAQTDGTTRYYDSIAIINEKGVLLDSYRKTQLYGQQERDNWSFGTGDYRVHQIFGFPVGVLNCYECEFPELSRILALKGAKLIVGPPPPTTTTPSPAANGAASPTPIFQSC